MKSLLSRFSAVLPLVVLLVAVPSVPAYVPIRETPKKDNTNSILKKHKDSLKGTASTTYSTSWPTANLFDGNLESSWFSSTGDSAAQGTKPWVEIELPQDETVARVGIMGNRDPSYPTGYSVLEGSVELMDKNRKVLWTGSMKSIGDLKDFDFKPGNIKGVRFIRFNSTKDEGDINGSRDIAIGEILVD